MIQKKGRNLVHLIVLLAGDNFLPHRLLRAFLLSISPNLHHPPIIFAQPMTGLQCLSNGYLRYPPAKAVKQPGALHVSL